MSRSGIWAQIGYGVESTVGTYATPTRFLEMVSESMQLQVDRVESRAIRSATRTLRSNRWVTGRRSISGSVVHEVADRGFGLPLAAAFGGGTWAIATPSGGTATRDVTITQGTNYGRGMTVQVGRPDTSGTVNAFSYLGCKVNSAELSSSVDGILSLSMSMVGIDETTGQSLASVSYPSTQSLLSWVGGTFNFGGAALDVKDFSLSVSHGLTDRFFMRGSGPGTLTKEHIEAAMAEVSGSFTVEFDSLTQYNRYVNGTTGSLAGTWQGGTTESGTYYSLIVALPVVRFDGETPNVGGPDILTLNVPFKGLVSGTLSPYTITYRTTDTAA